MPFSIWPCSTPRPSSYKAPWRWRWRMKRSSPTKRPPKRVENGWVFEGQPLQKNKRNQVGGCGYEKICSTRSCWVDFYILLLQERALQLFFQYQARAQEAYRRRVPFLERFVSLKICWFKAMVHNDKWDVIYQDHSRSQMWHQNPLGIRWMESVAANVLMALDLAHEKPENCSTVELNGPQDETCL